ncbi:hypothetical protein K3495_g3301 [Podosphaera aphanis]|nr:hypothetical protein K3495_g3301 [Podosphaera aphanis]
MENIHTFTPARKIQTSTNSNGSHRVLEKEWTAARCQRLLRTLTSRVAILKKELTRYSDSSTQTDRELKLGIVKFKSLESTNTNRKLSRTYGKTRKCQHSNLKSSRTTIQVNDKKKISPGKVSVPTPLLARIRAGRHEEQDKQGIIISSKPRPQSMNRHFQLSKSLQELRQNTTTSRYNAYRGIYHGLETILHTTSQDNLAVNRKGSKTLLESTLRVIPRYIMEQEELLQIHMYETSSKSAIDDRDISGEIYNELENLSSTGKGWKFLKNVVRAHGVQVVCDAIREELLDTEYCGTLISLCIRLGSIEEAQTILSSLLSSKTYPYPETLYGSPGSPLSLLLKFTEHTNQTCYLYRELNNLISGNKLHLEWLGTEYFGPVWTGLIQSLSLEPIEHDAFSFIDSALSSFLKSSNSTLLFINECSDQDIYSTQKMISGAVKNTFTSLLTILTSIVLLQRGPEVASPTKSNHSVHIGVCHIISLIRGFSVYGSSERDKNIYHLLFMFASLIINKDRAQFCPDGFASQNLKSSLGDSEMGTSNRAQVALFIYEVARCCGRGTAGSGFDYLRLIHYRLKKFTSEIKDPNFLSGVIFDSAFAFARNYPDRQHVDYASSMGASYCTVSHQLVASLASGSQRFGVNRLCGLRWEEGIGEWVTSTPANSKFKRDKSEMVEYSNFQTPTCQMSKRRRISVDSPSLQLPSLIYSKRTADTVERNVPEDFSNKINATVDKDIRIQLTHVPIFEQIGIRSCAEQASPSGIDQVSDQIHSLFQNETVEIKSKLKLLVKSPMRFSYSPSQDKFPSYTRSPEGFKYSGHCTMEHAPENKRHHFKDNNRQMHLLNSSPCKNSSLRRQTSTKWLKTIRGEEDELSHLSAISPPTSNHSRFSLAQIEEYISHDNSSAINPSFNKTIIVNTKRSNSKKNEPKFNTKSNMKKSFLRTKRLRGCQIKQILDGSEDELCG